MAEGRGLLFPRDPFQVFVGQFQQVLELAHPVVVDFAGVAFDDRVVQQPLRFLRVAPCDVQRVFQGGLVFNAGFCSMATLWFPFPADSSASAGNRRRKNVPVRDVPRGLDLYGQPGGLEDGGGVLGGERRRVDAGHFLDDADHLAAVAELVVVPDVEDALLPVEMVARPSTIAGAAGADEVGGDDLGRIDVVDLLVQLASSATSRAGSR